MKLSYKTYRACNYSVMVRVAIHFKVRLKYRIEVTLEVGIIVRGGPVAVPQICAII